MTGSHVFVVHADLLAVACDYYLIPTDVTMEVMNHWKAVGKPPPKPSGWGRETRVTEPRPWGADRTVRWVDSGGVAGATTVGWLREAVSQALTRAAEDIGPSTVARHKRARPLLGMPIFGTGGGGFNAIRGEVLEMLLEVAHAAAATAPFDIAIVCSNRAVYAALQSRPSRLELSKGSLSTDQLAVADDLGTMARDGRLVLFLGAGASAPAGLPTWWELLGELTAGAGQPIPAGAPTDAPEIVAQRLRDAIADDEEFLRRVSAALTRDQHALGHAVLASLRINEVVTTNFDDLYEKAAIVPFAGRTLRVLPWDRAAPGDPWLLKMHGGIGRSHIVFTEKDYDNYDVDWRPLAGIVQALLMTRHMLFVGFSLTDQNFLRLGREVSKLLSKTYDEFSPPAAEMVGTVLTLSRARGTSDAAAPERWDGDLRTLAVAESGSSVAEAGRRLEILLDRVAAVAAAREHSYLLDKRYRVLVKDEDRVLADRLRGLAEELATRGDEWSEIGEVLRAHGAHR